MHDVYVNIDLGELLRFGVPFAIVVGWLSGRLLGVRRGWGRAFVAGLIGWLGGVIVAASIEGTDDLSTIAAPTLFFGVLFAMFASIAFDLLLRPKAPRHRRLGWLLHPIAAIRRRLAPLGRFREIIHHARERGLTKLRYASASKVATPDFARRLRLTLEDCGGMFVKFGQIASTRSDLLPSVVTDELAQLQSAVRPVPADQVREVLEAELGATVEEEFASFDWEPLAAASIGQTHRATLKTGEGVVVKVQRPGIEDVVNRDAAVLRLVASTAERRIEAAHQIGLRRLADDLITSLRRELDYAAEAANAHEFREDRLGEEGVSTPGVYLALSTRRVLVMEEVDGTTVADHAAVAASGVAPAVLSRRLLSSFLDQVLLDGTYHADPHPGNVFVDRHGTLWFLDFGAVGHLDPMVLESMQEMAIGFQLRDPVVLARAVRRLAGSGDTPDSRALEGDIGVLLSEVLSRRRLRPAGHWALARGDATPRPPTATSHDGAVAGAAHARGHAAHDRRAVLTRARGERAPAPARRPPGRRGEAAAGEGAPALAAGAADVARPPRGHRLAAARGSPGHSRGAVRGARPGGGRRLDRPGGVRRDRHVRARGVVGHLGERAARRRRRHTRRARGRRLCRDHHVGGDAVALGSPHRAGRGGAGQRLQLRSSRRRVATSGLRGALC